MAPSSSYDEAHIWIGLVIFLKPLDPCKSHMEIHVLESEGEAAMRYEVSRVTLLFLTSNALLKVLDPNLYI